MKSGHPWKLNKVVDGKPPRYPWDDISYVIGGYNWKARFIGKAGWTTYHSGEKKPYSCGSCHTTGYSDWPPDSHQDGLRGLIGTWAESGISCERCHGPGSLHAKNPRGVSMKIDRSSAQCGECHVRGNPEAVNASGGFIKHHEQYEELFQSKHIVPGCVLCHDPHKGVIQLRKAGEQTTRTQCANCHFEKAKHQASQAMAAMGVKCIDCHMPRVAKSAVGNAAKFTGDIRTHLMAVDPEQIGRFSADGKTSLSQRGLNFSCRSCHVKGGSTLLPVRFLFFGRHTAPDSSRDSGLIPVFHIPIVFF